MQTNEISTKLSDELKFFETKLTKRDEIFDNLAQAFDSLSQEIERIKNEKQKTASQVAPVDPFGDIINIDEKYATREEINETKGQLETLKG